mmetsp:Transcript_30814/g.65107  ORF Transcript_30814/g.65107 Transcript_30814/m.65107 type:complete len:351 (+) Transcript_30814:110-1162(+)
MTSRRQRKGQAMPTARIPFTKRKRRYPSTTTASSIHAILLLLACGSPFQLEHHGKITFVGALIAPLLLPARHNDWLSQQQRRNIKKNIFQHSLVLSTTDLMATTSVDVADEPTSTRIKGKSSSPPSTQLKNGKQNKQKSSRKGNYQKKNTSKSRILKTTTPADPWNADYTTSLKTQRKIQSAAADARSRGSTTSDPVDAAHAVLKTLLNAPPTECNAANIVCALTLSSKTLNHRGSGRGGNNNRHDAHQSPPLAEDESSAFQKSLMKTPSYHYEPALCSEGNTNTATQNICHLLHAYGMQAIEKCHKITTEREKHTDPHYTDTTSLIILFIYLSIYLQSLVYHHITANGC